MDTSKLEVGMRIKNYKVLCELLGERVRTGQAKQNHLMDFKRYVKYKKDGNSFIIIGIFPTPEAKLDKRKIEGKKSNNRKSFKQFNIPMELENKKGVYKITQGKNIYIGSTFREEGFRARFRGHLYKTNKTITRDMLLQGGLFESIWICDDNLEDEHIVRKIEEYFIKYFKENTNLNVVNNRDETYVSRITSKGVEKRRINKVKYSNIRVKLEDYSKVIELLKENNIEFTEHKKRRV